MSDSSTSELDCNNGIHCLHVHSLEHKRQTVPRKLEVYCCFCKQVWGYTHARRTRRATG